MKTIPSAIRLVRGLNLVAPAVWEAGMSRIYGGIHFMSANLSGLECGVTLGGCVVDNFLRPRPGKPHRGP
jgi:hypothetical protein